MCKDDDVGTIAGEIMAYLKQRPMASDSLDGIIHWWLIQQSIVNNKKRVEQALEQLAQQGKIAKKINPNRGTIYSLGKAYKPGND